MIGRVVGTVGLILKLKIRGEAQALMICSSSLLGVVGTITGSFDEDAARNKLDRKAMLAAWFSVRRRSGSDMVRFRERQGLLLSATASFILLELPRRRIILTSQLLINHDCECCVVYSIYYFCRGNSKIQGMHACIKVMLLIQGLSLVCSIFSFEKLLGF